MIDWVNKIDGNLENSRERPQCFQNGRLRMAIFVIFYTLRIITDFGICDVMVLNIECVTVFGCRKGRIPEFRIVGRVCVDMAIQNTVSRTASYPRCFAVIPRYCKSAIQDVV